MSQVQAHQQHERCDVVVIGGGLAGLTAATVAARAGRSVIVLERQTPGGRARTDRCGDFLFNRGPRALYADGAGRAVLTELGVSTDHGAPPKLSGAMGLHGGRLHLLPQGPISLLRTSLLPWKEKVKTAAQLARLPRVDPDEFTGMTGAEAIRSFGLGPSATELLTALCRLSTYTAALDHLDGATTIRQLQMGMGGGAIYLDGGWQTIVDQLAAMATSHGASIRTGAAVREIVTADDSPVVILADDRTIGADTVVLAVGDPQAAASLLGITPAGWSGIGEASTVACLELGLRRTPPTPLVLGVDEPLYLSTHAPPADLAPDGCAVVHLMRYLHPDDDTRGVDHRDQLWSLAQRAGISEADVVEQRFLARMVASGAIPIPDAGGVTGRPDIQVPEAPGVFIAGDWVGSTGFLADAALVSGSAAGKLAVSRSATLEVA